MLLLALPIAVAAAALGVGQPAVAQETATEEAGSTFANDPEDLAGAMLGGFATTLDNTDQTIIDRRYRYTILGDDGVWIYSQLNTGEDQRVYRQRFHRLSASKDGTHVIQRSFVPLDTDKYVDPWGRSNGIPGLSLADLKPALNEGCDQIWERDSSGTWRGAVDPRTCLIYSERRQSSIRIGADAFYRDDMHGTAERGFDEEMNPIWGSAPGEFILLERCKSPLCKDEARALSQRP